MKRFYELLNREASRSASAVDDRRWVYVPYDQLHAELGPLGDTPPQQLGIVLIESPAKAARRPYHKQKLAFILANQRHFALEQARRGVSVHYRVCDDGYASILQQLADELGPLTVVEPAERELRVELAPLIESGALERVPHEGWLTTTADFEESQKRGKSPKRTPWRMDAFYRHSRRQQNLLMTEDGKPIGGKYSFDADNRKSWPGEPEAPSPPTFPDDDVTLEVAELIESHFQDHPGQLDLTHLPRTAEHAEQMWKWAKESCLPHFGPYEDAMSTASRGLFHTRLSPLLNVHRILPRRVVDEAIEMELPLASREGFVRQIVGWREFVRHVHYATDGFRKVDSVFKDDGVSEDGTANNDDPAHADPSYLASRDPLPDAYWGTPSGLHCLDTVVASVWEEAYSHHITRLMVLSNLATLLDVSPRELTDWFWIAYVDAYDWVVEPNVLAMGTFAVGDLMTTKPYVSGAAYIHRMSDYCSGCNFDPKKNCPITPLYWAFLNRKHPALDGNPRMSLPLRNAAKRSDTQKAHDAKIFEWVRTALAHGDTLTPDETPAPP